MKFVIMSRGQLPFYNGACGPILTPVAYDIHLVLKWIATGVDVREVMDDGSFRKLEFNDERVMKELDEDLERKRIEKEQHVKLLEEEQKVEVKKVVPKKVNIYPAEPVKPVKEKKKEKPIVEKKKELVVKEEPIVEKKKTELEVDELEPME